MRKALALGIVVVSLSGLYLAWSAAGRTAPAVPSEPRLEHVLHFGAEGAARRLVGVQPWMEPADFASAEAFSRKLDAYLKAAADEGLLGPGAVVVFPEYLGTWLVAVGEKRAVYEASTIDEAMQTLVLANLPAFLWNLLSAEADDKVKDSLFRMKAEEMAAAYHAAFSSLARRYETTLVAGSIVLPSPRVEGGSIVVGDGPLENVTAVYGPDGRPMRPLVRKVFPIEEEKPFLRGVPVETLPVFETPAGRLGVLICADSWYPRAYDVLRDRGIDLLAVPSYLGGDGAWDKPWGGYNGARAPVDVDPKDPGKITEGEAWLRYALAGRMQEAGAKAGINVFLRGRIWNLGSDGMTVAVLGRERFLAPHTDGATVVSLGLPAR